MSGIRKCVECGNLFKLKNAGPEAMRGDGTFPKHVCKKCSGDELVEVTADETLPTIKLDVVREFLDALEGPHRPNLRMMAEQPDSALSRDGLRLKRAYIALRDLDDIASFQRRCVQLASMYPIENDGIHPDISWADTSEPAKGVAWTTAQQIAVAIERIGEPDESD